MGSKMSGLGKGLDAIFMDNETEDKNSTIVLRISEIEPNREQPRKEFDEEALAELAQSIAQHGILQPILVRPLFGGGYQIVAGERRWRASRMAGLMEVPVVIRELSDAEAMKIALIENLQREDLSIIEESEGYKNLMDNYGLTQEEVAKTVGKSRPAVSNALRLLNLPAEVIDLLKNGDITSGHARTLLALENKELIIPVAKKIAEKGISVRELEKLVKELNTKANGVKKEKNITKNKFFREVELSLKDFLGRKVTVNSSKGKKGILQIEFYGEDDLNEIVRLFMKD